MIQALVLIGLQKLTPFNIDKRLESYYTVIVKSLFCVNWEIYIFYTIHSLSLNSAWRAQEEIFQREISTSAMYRATTIPIASGPLVRRVLAVVSKAGDTNH